VVCENFLFRLTFIKHVPFQYCVGLHATNKMGVGRIQRVHQLLLLELELRPESLFFCLASAAAAAARGSCAERNEMSEMR